VSVLSTGKDLTISPCILFRGLRSGI